MWFSHPLDFSTCQLSATLLWQILLVRAVQSASASTQCGVYHPARCKVHSVHCDPSRGVYTSRDFEGDLGEPRSVLISSWKQPQGPKFPILLSRTTQWGSLPVGWSPLTIGVSATLQSEPRDLWPLIRPIWVTLGDFRIFRRFSGFLGYFWMIFRF